MDKLEAIRVFAAVVEGGSFVSASRALNLSAPAVTRSIARLEAALGVRLFHRTTRAIRLTDSGQQYYTDVKNILDSLEEAEASVTGTYRDPQGILTITAPVLFGHIYIVPIIAEFLDKYPKVTVNSVFHDRVSNLLEENLDVAVRIGHLADSSLFAARVGSIRRVVCASPAYLAEHGRPKKPEDLENHAIVYTTAVESSNTWLFHNKKVRVTPRYLCNQNGAAVQAAERGVGITRVMSYQAADALKSGTLELLLEEYESDSIPVSIVYLEGRRANAKIRVFVDFAAQRLRENRFLNPNNGSS